MATKKSLSPIRVGQAVLIRTVTMHYTGEIVEILAGEIILRTAAWIADTGRFGEALATGSLSEIEVMPGHVAIARGAIVDVSAWNHTLPTKSV